MPEWILEYIDAVEWQFAKSMPDHPHFYTNRWKRPDLDSVFCSFAQYIRDHGYTEMFYRRPMVYLNVGEWKYWTMGAPIRGPFEVPKNENTFILNRAKIENRYGGHDEVHRSEDSES